MNPAIASMLGKYTLRSLDDHINALREVLQEIALCGLWRGKFFEKAAFYGGTALRVLHGLDRFSEDMDFSLVGAGSDVDLLRYCAFVKEELGAWGFDTAIEPRKKSRNSAIESAFLKADTRELLLAIDAGKEFADAIHPGQRMRIKLELDTDPPPRFGTETRFLLAPVPFSVRVYDPPSLFAGKMHAVLCRAWKTRVKGRDLYDFVWYVGRRTELNLRHLEARMHQTGHLKPESTLDESTFRRLLVERIDTVDLTRAREDVERFLADPSAVEIWSREFFRAAAERLVVRNQPE